METFAWEPPDGEAGACVARDGSCRSVVWVGDSSCSQFGASCRLGGGHGWEMPRREGDGHGAAAPGSGLEAVEVGGGQEVQLDLGLSDITRYSSYSKLWRTLYFVNDAPFRIRNHRFVAAMESGLDWTPWPLSVNGNWAPSSTLQCALGSFQA